MLTFKFKTFTIQHPTVTCTYNPNTWLILRSNDDDIKIISIIQPDVNGQYTHKDVIDEQTDTGQSDFDAVLWGIGWLHIEN